MDTLPNVNTRRGGENPSSAGLASCALPEAQGAPGAARCSEGESSNFIPKDRPQWFVLRATYGFARRQRHRDLRSDARHHETHQREAENLSRASASRYCFRPVEPHNGRTVRQGSRPLLQMAEILHRQNQTPRKRHRPQSSHRYSRQRNAQLHQSHQCPQRA